MGYCWAVQCVTPPGCSEPSDTLQSWGQCKFEPQVIMLLSNFTQTYLLNISLLLNTVLLLTCLFTKNNTSLKLSFSWEHQTHLCDQKFKWDKELQMPAFQGKCRTDLEQWGSYINRTRTKENSFKQHWFDKTHSRGPIPPWTSSRIAKSIWKRQFFLLHSKQANSFGKGCCARKVCSQRSEEGLGGAVASASTHSFRKKKRYI